MDAKKRKMYVFIVLIAVSIWGYFNIFDSEEKKVVEIKDDVEMVSTSESAPSNIVEIDFSEYASKKWGSDPFFRGKTKANARVKVEKPNIEWVLGGILYSDKDPAAVVNKRVVRKGDIIDGARVMEINRTDVKMEKDGTSFILGIKKEIS
jgi:type II secretory pathway component PulC